MIAGSAAGVLSSEAAWPLLILAQPATPPAAAYVVIAIFFSFYIFTFHTLQFFRATILHAGVIPISFTQRSISDGGNFTNMNTFPSDTRILMMVFKQCIYTF